MKILITAPYNEKAQRELQAALGEIVYKPWKAHGKPYTENELVGMLREHRAEALITEHDHVSQAVIEQFPQLQFIGVCRGTPSNVAVATAREKGIPVFHTPARNAQAVAEMFVSNVIMLLRNTIAGWQWLQAEKWQAGSHTSYLQFKGNELAGSTVGMVGFGAVGQRIAGLLKAFDCRVQFYDPYVQRFDSEYITKVSLEEVFESSDIVSIHLPVTDETKGMIDRTLISKMKKEAIFVNTARASVVNRHDLLQALEKNLIRGAVLDVFDSEPPDETDYRIIHLPNVLATPHIAGATFEVEDHHAAILNKALFDHFSGEKPAKKRQTNDSLS